MVRVMCAEEKRYANKGEVIKPNYKPHYYNSDRARMSNQEASDARRVMRKEHSS